LTAQTAVAVIGIDIGKNSFHSHRGNERSASFAVVLARRAGTSSQRQALQ
jgi:hypothetical protein